MQPCSTTLIVYTAMLDTLWQAGLLCQVCEERPWTQWGHWHAVLLCQDCADGEPEPEPDR
jgi:hypothetical protein